MSIPLPLVALLGASALWCGVMWVGYLRAERNKTELELRQERINDENRKLLSEPLRVRLRAKLASYGWDGSPTPLLLSMLFAYMACGVGLTFVGVTGFAAIVLALPFSTLVAVAAAARAQGKRQAAFNSQLVQALELFAANLKAGAGSTRAIETVLPTLPEPLRGEMSRAMEQHRSRRSLADAVEDIARRYPSNAMRKFVAVLRIDETGKGGEMAPALEEAAASVRRDSELESEAHAEVAEQRGQFFGIIFIIAGIALYMYTASGAQNQQAMRSPMGLLAVGVMGLNFAFGVFRSLRLFAKIKGGL